MVIKARDNNGELVFTALAKNKQEAREIILSDKNKMIIKTVEYGRKIYSMSDVYGRF